MTIRALVWGENVHERTNKTVASIYPDGMHTCIAAGLNEDSEITASTAVLQDDEHGLTEQVLANTDVLFWWGHAAHQQVDDAIVERVLGHVWQGMGLVCLHSAHFSKIFRRVTGAPCALRWREAGERERVWVCNPNHPIAQGIGPCLEIPNSEMYGEPFTVAEPDETVFVSWYEGGDVFRSGLTFKRGAGKIFYFGPGHETYPIYWHDGVKRVLKNAAKWAVNPVGRWANIDDAPNAPVDQAREKIEVKGPKLHAEGEAGMR
ncbi:MAG: ThuA domain-containing protein [Pseudomonadota bacterium]